MGAVDAHLHLFPDEPSGLLAQGGERLAGHAGVPDEVRSIASTGRIDRVLAIASVAPEIFRRFQMGRWTDDLDEAERDRRRGELEERLWSQVAERNHWICSLAAEDQLFSAVLAADPTLDQERMVNDLKGKAGLRQVAAIKVHPALSFVTPDHPNYLPVYRLAQEAALPVISHGGSSAGSFYESEVEYCAPANFGRVLDQFPRLTLVVAHLGQPFYGELLALSRDHANLYSDLSFVLGARLLEPPKVAETVRAFGIERVFFGSDFPFFDPEDSLDRLSAAGFSAGELEMISSGNAERIFTR